MSLGNGNMGMTTYDMIQMDIWTTLVEEYGNSNYMDDNGKEFDMSQVTETVMQKLSSIFMD